MKKTSCKATVWIVHKSFKIDNLDQLNELIPTSSEITPGSAYSNTKYILIVRRGAPNDPSQDSCLRVQSYQIPNEGCSVFPVIWNDQIWHKGGDWQRHWFFSQPMYAGDRHRPTRGHTEESIYELLPDNNYEMLGIHLPDKEQLDIPLNWEPNELKDFDLEVIA